MNSYKELLELDLRVLPTEVLKRLQFESAKELGKRRASNDNSCREISASFPGLPNPKFVINNHADKYLKVLMNQDWSHLFDGDEEEKYYVYIHLKPSSKKLTFICEGLDLNLNGFPFYVGKGCGDRAWDLKRNQGHGAILRDLNLAGCTPSDIVHIVATEITEAKALEIESKLIYLFGTKYESDRKGVLVNLDIPARPEMCKWKDWVKENYTT